MNGENNRFNLIELMKKMAGWIAVFIGLIAQVAALVKLYNSDRGIVTITLIGIGIISIIIIYPRVVGIKKIALKILVLIAVIGTAWWGYLYIRPSDKVIVLLTNLKGPDQEKIKMTNHIYEELNTAFINESSIKIKPLLDQSISIQEGSATAKKIGKKNKASIVIWGWYTVTSEVCKLYIHYEVLKKINQPIFESGTQRGSLSQLANLEFQTSAARPIKSFIYFTVGMIYYNEFVFDKANKNFLNALNSIGTDIDQLLKKYIYYFKGNSNFSLGNYKDSISDYQEAIKLDTTNLDFYFNIGNAFSAVKNYQEAITNYDKAISLNAHDWDSYINRGCAFFDLKDYSKAIADFNIVIANKPNDWVVWNNRGDSYVEINNYDSAINDYKVAIDRKNSAVIPRLNLAEVYLISGQANLAEQSLLGGINYFKSLEDRATALCFLLISLKYQGKDIEKWDQEFDELCKKDFKINWTFEKILAWADINIVDPDLKTFINNKIANLHNHS